MSRKIPEIPSASLADIAFMLLIFFLVTTTMDVDSGLERRLPQWSEEEPEDQPEIKDRNVFSILVNRNNDLLVENEILDIDDLRDKAKEFMENPYDDENLPEKEIKDIPYFGQVPVTKGVISLLNDRDTKYGTYIAVQNELVAAINELRDELAKRQFGKAYDDLDEDQQDAIKKIYPQRISEADRNR